MIKDDIFDYFVRYPYPKIFTLAVDKWKDEENYYAGFEKILNKKNIPEYVGKVLWNNAQKSEKLMSFFVNLENNSIFQIIINDVNIKELESLFIQKSIFQKKQNILMINIIQKMKDDKLKELLTTPNLEDEFQSLFVHSFKNNSLYIINCICERKFSHSKLRMLITVLDINEIINYQTQKNENLFSKLINSNLESLVLLILKRIEKDQPKLKPILKEMLSEKDEHGDSLLEYMLSSQNKIFFIYMNSYFEETIFDKFYYLEAFITDSVKEKIEIKKNDDGFKDMFSFMEFIREVIDKNLDQLEYFLKVFSENNNIHTLEKNKIVNFSSEFVNTKESFMEMIQELKKENIISIDMEYYKAGNESSTESKYNYYLF